VINKVNVRTDVALLNSRIKQPETSLNKLFCQLIFVIEVCEIIGNYLQFVGSQGANCADLIIYFHHFRSIKADQLRKLLLLILIGLNYFFDEIGDEVYLFIILD
jgi:hypothetical protein